MLTQLPFTTSEEIAAEFRPEKPGRAQSALRTLKAHNAVSDGVSKPLRRRSGGRLGGKLTLYSSLNLDAARFARDGDYEQAAKIAIAAAELELAVQMQTLMSDIVARVSSSDEAGIGKSVLMSAVRDGQQTLAATKVLAETTEQVRGSLKIANLRAERLFGRVAELTPELGLVRLEGLSDVLAVHLDALNSSGSSFVGAPLMLTWERWPGGKTLMSADAALDLAAGDQTEREATDVGYPYVVPLPSRDAPALVLNTVAGMRPTMRAARRIHIHG